MPGNYIVLRASPNWLDFNLEDSRAFCRRHRLPTNLVIQFAERWDQTFALDYRKFRHEMKEIALGTFAAARDSHLIHLTELGSSPSDDDLFLFTDDDDWVAPNLFEVLRTDSTPQDGFLWGSIFLGKFLVDLPGMKVGTPVLQKRRHEDVIYTNNYCVTGRAIKRLGLRATLEQDKAQLNFDYARFLPRRIPPYLSCANKHPCSTIWVHYNWKVPGFLGQLRETVGGFVQELTHVEPDSETLWTTPFLDRLKTVMERCLSPRSGRA